MRRNVIRGFTFFFPKNFRNFIDAKCKCDEQFLKKNWIMNELSEDWVASFCMVVQRLGGGLSKDWVAGFCPVVRRLGGGFLYAALKIGLSHTTTRLGIEVKGRIGGRPFFSCFSVRDVSSQGVNNALPVLEK